MKYLGHETEFRGPALVERRAKFHIVIMGVGALGSKLVNILATQGFSTLTLIDKDRVEEKNFGTQDFGRRDVGRMKASQARANLHARLGPIATIDAIDKEVTESNVGRFIKSANLVLDCFDNYESRNILKQACAAAGIECLHIGMSGDGFSEVEWNNDYQAIPSSKRADVDAEGNPCEYPLAANLVHLTVGIASEVIVSFADNGKKRSVHFTLRDLHSHLLR